nr:putative solute-binding protein [Alkalimarinus sediminis]
MTSLAQASITTKSFCVWDPVGKSGPVSALINSLSPKAISWGVNLKLEIYTDEKVAANDFKAGVCDAVVTTDISARDFNLFTSTFSAVGAIQGEQELRTLLSTVSSPKAAKLMRQGEYEVGGILPIGSVYIYVNDKNISRVEKLQGRKMAVVANDPVVTTMVRRIGGSAVPSSLANLAGQFNSGGVDIIFAPAVAYNIMELYKGLNQGGGIVKYPLLNTSLQIILRHDAFPEDFGQKMREYSLSQVDSMLKLVDDAESEIPADHWITISEDVKTDYDAFMRKSRLALKDEGYNQPLALTVMRKVRCKYSPTNTECVLKQE